MHAVDPGGWVALVGVLEVLCPAGLHDGHIIVHDHVLRAGMPFQLGAAGIMVPVGMTDQQHPNVAETLAQLLDAGADLRDGLLETGVDENVAGFRDDEVGSQVAAAHVVQVADDPKRRDRGGPVRIAQPREIGVAGGRCRPSRRKQVRMRSGILFDRPQASLKRLDCFLIKLR